MLLSARRRENAKLKPWVEVLGRSETVQIGRVRALDVHTLRAAIPRHSRVQTLCILRCNIVQLDKIIEFIQSSLCKLHTLELFYNRFDGSCVIKKKHIDLLLLLKIKLHCTNVVDFAMAFMYAGPSLIHRPFTSKMQLALLEKEAQQIKEAHLVLLRVFPSACVHLRRKIIAFIFKSCI
jgi:hypothetical protein